MSATTVTYGDYVPAQVPRPAIVVTQALSLITFATVAVCLTRRTQAIRRWSKLPLSCWLIIAIYVDCFFFVFCTAILSHGFGLNSTRSICSASILLCLTCYMTSKILIYTFLVEKAYIIRGSKQPRMKSRLYLLNCFGMLVPYVIIVIFNYVFRIAFISEDGECRIGMEKKVMMPLIIFDVVVNVYLTALFLIPLQKLHSYKQNANPLLRSIALRTFIGSLGTLTSSVANLTVLMLMEGQPAWICLMCCNIDVLFSVLVLHWVTSKDNVSTSGSSQDPKSNSHHTSTLPQPRTTNRRNSNHLESDYRMKPGVITSISGVQTKDHADIPMHSIMVETRHTREVLEERDIKDKESTASTTDEQAPAHHNSTEDLVYPPRDLHRPHVHINVEPKYN